MDYKQFEKDKKELDSIGAEITALKNGIFADEWERANVDDTLEHLYKRYNELDRIFKQKYTFTLVWKNENTQTAYFKVFTDLNDMKKEIKTFIDKDFSAYKLKAIDKTGNIYYYGD